jgi:hypothetical protein
VVEMRWRNWLESVGLLTESLAPYSTAIGGLHVPRIITGTAAAGAAC